VPRTLKMSSGFYLYGDDLNPLEITDLLGIEPTGAHLKGEVVVGKTTGRAYSPRKTGLWSHVISLDGEAVEEVVAGALGYFDRVDRDLSSLPNVTRANFDVFATALCGPEDDHQLEFEFTPLQLGRLAYLGVVATISLGTIPTEDD
jgi:Domain of unknown function (DUF4279)